jgi:hypothetical protein
MVWGYGMGEKRVRRCKELKFKVALEAIRGEKQLAQIVHPQQVTRRKKELLDSKRPPNSTCCTAGG